MGQILQCYIPQTWQSICSEEKVIKNSLTLFDGYSLSHPSIFRKISYSSNFKLNLANNFPTIIFKIHQYSCKQPNAAEVLKEFQGFSRKISWYSKLQLLWLITEISLTLMLLVTNLANIK